MDFGAVAMAPGYGVGWVTLDPDDAQPTAEISLRPEQVIHGRLFDVQGRPVPDVGVSVQSIRSDAPRRLGPGFMTVPFIAVLTASPTGGPETPAFSRHGPGR